VTDIEQKALALVSQHGQFKALRIALEQHEAFKQKVSDIVGAYVNADGGPDDWENLNSLIIPKPKPDPLVDVAKSLGYFNTTAQHWAGDVRAALDALGFEVREKGQ
jgi:hypothetical protein